MYNNITQLQIQYKYYIMSTHSDSYYNAMLSTAPGVKQNKMTREPVPVPYFYVTIKNDHMSCTGISCRLHWG